MAVPVGPGCPYSFIAWRSLNVDREAALGQERLAGIGVDDYQVKVGSSFVSSNSPAAPCYGAAGFLMSGVVGGQGLAFP
jgi:hypothetical protein